MLSPNAAVVTTFQTKYCCEILDLETTFMSTDVS